MKLIELFLKNGMNIETNSREEELEISQNLDSFLKRKKYIETSIQNGSDIEVFLYDEYVCLIEIKNSTLKTIPYSENFFEVLVDCMEFMTKVGHTIIEEEPSEESEEESDEWI